MSEKSRKQAPQWFMLRNEILGSIGRMNSAHADRLTYNVMTKATRLLMARQALPDGLKKTFIENIRRRTKHANFDYHGPIQLSGNQWKHARKTGQDVMPDLTQLLTQHNSQELGTTFQDEVQDEVGGEEAILFEALQLWFIHQSSIIQPDFTLLSSILGLEPAQALEFWWRNIMKSNEMNHESDMTSASQSMRLAGSPDAHDLPRTGHEPAALGRSHARTFIEEHEPEELVAPGEQSATGAAGSREVVISYFHRDPARAPSANLEFCGTRYALVFSPIDVAEDKIFKASDPEWWKLVDRKVLENLRVRSRNAMQQGMVQRFALSPIYAAHDTFGRARASEGNAMAILRWTDGAEPEAIELVVEDQLIAVPLLRYAGRNDKAPSYKGRVIIAGHSHGSS